MPAAPRISPVRQGSSVPNFMRPCIFPGSIWISSFFPSCKIRLIPLLNFSFSRNFFIFFILSQMSPAVNQKFFKALIIFSGDLKNFSELSEKDRVLSFLTFRDLPLSFSSDLSLHFSSCSRILEGSVSPGVSVLVSFPAVPSRFFPSSVPVRKGRAFFLLFFLFFCLFRCFRTFKSFRTGIPKIRISYPALSSPLSYHTVKKIRWKSQETPAFPP